MRVVALPARGAAQVQLALLRVDRNLRSPYGHVQGELMPGARWRATLAWGADLLFDERREVSRWLVEASARNVYTTCEPLGGGGGSPAGFGELLSNPDFYGVTGWTAVNAALTAGGRKLRVQNSDGVNAASAKQTLALTAGRSYALLAHSGKGSHDLYELLFQYDTGPVTLVSLSTTTEGLLLAVATAANTGNHSVMLRSRVAGAGNYTFYTGASFARCALVDGAAQTGRSLAIKGLDVSTDAILRAGDFVTVATDATAGTGKANPKLECKRLTADLNSDSAGNGRLHFEPPLRNTPNDNAPVLIQRPRFYGFFPESSPAMEHIGTSLRASLSLTLEEDILAPG